MNVAEFSRRVGLTAHTVRYYDKIGLLDDIRRLSNGHRSFSEKDVAWVEFVQRLKDTGMSIDKILEYSSLRKEGSDTLAQRKEMLTEHSINLRQKISLEEQHLQKLCEKIEIYQSALDGEISLD